MSKELGKILGREYKEEHVTAKEVAKLRRSATKQEMPLLTKLAKLDSHEHHEDALLRQIVDGQKSESQQVTHLKVAETVAETKVAPLMSKLTKLESEVHHKDALLKEVAKEGKPSKKKEALLMANLAKLSSDVHHKDALLQKLERDENVGRARSTSNQLALMTRVARLNADAHERDVLVKKLETEVRHLRTAEKIEVHSDDIHLKGDEALLLRRFRLLVSNVNFTEDQFRTMLEKLNAQEKATMKEVLLLRDEHTEAWIVREVRKVLDRTQGLRWLNAAADEEGPLRRAINGLTAEIAKAKSNARNSGSLHMELKSSERTLSHLKSDLEQLTLHKVPVSYTKDMRAAELAMTFLSAASHPHIWHRGYIYATMDFANPSGDDDDDPPTNGHQRDFLTLPSGWHIAPATRESRRVSINFGWGTDCLTFLDGSSWQTSDGGSDNGFCGKHTLLKNKKKQYRPTNNGDHSRRILIRFMVPK